jgi:hypothetical protein
MSPRSFPHGPQYGLLFMNEITSLFGSLFNSRRWHQQAITKLTTPFSSFVTWASLLQGKPWGSDFMIQVISYFLGHFVSRVQISLHFI